MSLWCVLPLSYKYDQLTNPQSYRLMRWRGDVSLDSTLIASVWSAKELQAPCIRRAASVGLVHSAFGFYFEVKQRRARFNLVLGWVTARVLDREACPSHWTGCQAGQVVSLLGLGTVVATVSCWPLPPGMSAGFLLDNGGFSGYSGFLPQLKIMRRILIAWIW